MRGVSDPSVSPTKEKSSLSLSLGTHPVDHALSPDQGVVLDYSGFDEVSDELDLHGSRPLLGRRVLVIPLGRHRHGSSTQARHGVLPAFCVASADFEQDQNNEPQIDLPANQRNIYSETSFIGEARLSAP